MVGSVFISEKVFDEVKNQMGLTEKSEKYFKLFKENAENDKSIYKNLNLAMYYSYKGEKEKAIEHLKLN